MLQFGARPEEVDLALAARASNLNQAFKLSLKRLEPKALRKGSKETR